MAAIAGTDLDVFPLCLGGNVFGWTADAQESFAVLDAYVGAGGNFIDTADSYSRWAAGHTGGESETVIGSWLSARGRRDDVIIATKVGRFSGATSLTGPSIRDGIDASLARLGTDYVDLYYAHWDDPDTPLEETLAVFDELVGTGKVRYIAASNYGPERLAEALAVSAREGLARFVALQPQYNLLERDFEGSLADLCRSEELACVPYFALARGFLTGKYRAGGEVPSTRGPRLDGSAYVDERGLHILSALDDVAGARNTTLAAVSLAWLLAQPTVVAPVASARTPEQLTDLLPGARLRLSSDELEALTVA